MSTTPIPSPLVEDFKLNVEDFDAFANGTGSYTDRFGSTRLSLSQFMESIGYEVPVAFTTGLSITRVTQTITNAGNTYHARATSIPFTTTGVFNATQWDLIVSTPVETATHAAASKATPVDADEIPLVDSAASFGLKRLTWLNLKATLKTYFDTLYLTASGITMTGLLKFAAGSNIVSSATVNLSTATGNTVHITGTTGITGWTMTAGQIMNVIFDGILTLTHNATTNNLPSAANITTAAGDRATVYYDGTTTYVFNYVRVDGTSLISSSGGIGCTSRAFAQANGIDSNVFVSADEVVVNNSAGQSKVLSNFQQIVSLAASGAGGLDTGTVAASSWYGIWALAKDDGTQSATAALCTVLTGNTTSGSAVVTSISSTANMRAGMPVFSVNFPVGTVIKSVDSGTQVTMSRNALATTTGVNVTYVYNPVMPSGYTWKGLVTCAIRSDGTANKFPQAFTKLGRKVTPKVAAGTNVTQMPIIASGVNGNAGTPTWVAISLANYVSPLAVEATFGLACNAVAGNIQMLAPNSSYGANTSTTNRAPVIYSTSTSGTTDGTAQGKQLLESGNIYYIANATNTYLFCEGYEEAI